MTGNRDQLHASVSRVLDQLPEENGRRGWCVERLGSGKQSWVFLCRQFKDDSDPHGPRELVVKLYRAAALEDVRVIDREYVAAQLLHQWLDGARLENWTTLAPAPLLNSRDPAALVSTWVPGRPLSEVLRSPGEVTPDAIDLIARVLVGSLHLFWERSGAIYGDLNLKNVLTDLSARTLALVDAGAPRRVYECEAAPRQWYPASRDLAYLLYDTATAIRATAFRPGLRRRQLRLVEAVLSCYLDEFCAPSQRSSAVDEIRQCAHIHLGRIACTGGPAGGWRSMVRKTASGTIDTTLARLRAGGASGAAQYDQEPAGGVPHDVHAVHANPVNDAGSRAPC